MANTANPAAGAAGLSPAAVREQLQRILASRRCREAERLGDFLRFVVEETLAGRQDRLKQFTIAVGALGRTSGFNPRTDAIVRTSAHRLRSLLTDYYQELGAADPVRIELPTGTYTPVFRHHAAANHLPPSLEAITTGGPRSVAVVGRRPLPVMDNSTGKTARPTTVVSVAVLSTRPAETGGDSAAEPEPGIGVLAFEQCGRNCAGFAHGLVGHVVARLTRDRRYRVLGPLPQLVAGRSSKVPDVLGRTQDVRFVLNGRVCVGAGMLQITAWLYDKRTARNVWAENYRRSHALRSVWETADATAAIIVEALVGPWGAIPFLTEQETQGKSPAEMALHDVLVCRDRWIREFTRQSLADTVQALERMVQAFPDHAGPRAWLAWAYLDDFAHGMGVVDHHFARVDTLLKGALQLDPAAESEVRGMRGYAHFLRRERALALHEHEAAWRVNPDDPWTNIVFAADACALGEWDRGLALVRDVIAGTPHYPDWLHLIPAVHCHVTGKYELALAEAQRCHTDTFPWSPLCRAAVLGQLGQTQEAARELRCLLNLVPDFRHRHRELMRPILYSDCSVNAMLAGLQKADHWAP